MLGDYAKPGCCGPDTFRNSDAVFEGLLLLRDALSPEWLIFEHMILSTSYKFTNKLRKAFDGKFCAILMDAEFKQVVNKLAERNNGKTTTKYEGLLANYTRAKRTAIKLQFSGSFVEKVNPFIYDKKHMYEIIDGFIEKYERRGHVNARISDRNSELQAP